MITTEDIKNAIETFRADGTHIRVRDIAYSILSCTIDPRTAYQCLFGMDGFEEYSNDGTRDALTSYLKKNGFIRRTKAKDGDDSDGITFEENKREMEKLLAKTQQSLDDGIIETKDALKIMTDIRTKLNDKFQMERKNVDRTIIVEKKYNHVCERFRCECYLPTKEDLMEMYGLIEKK